VIIWCLAVLTVGVVGVKFSHAASLVLLTIISKAHAAVSATVDSRKSARGASLAFSTRCSADVLRVIEDMANLGVASVLLAGSIPTLVDAVFATKALPRWAHAASHVSLLTL